MISNIPGCVAGIIGIIVMVVVIYLLYLLTVLINNLRISRFMTSDFKCKQCGSDIKITRKLVYPNTTDIEYKCTVCESSMYNRKLLNVKNVITNRLNRINEIRKCNNLLPLKKLSKKEIQRIISSL